MEYRVEFTKTAKRELEQISARVMSNAPITGLDWLMRFDQSIQSLKYLPERCPVVAYQGKFETKVRRHLFGNKSYVYRIFYKLMEIPW